MAVVGRDCAEGRKWLTPAAPGVRMARLGRCGDAPVGPAVPGGPGRPRGRQQQVRGTQRSAPWPGPRRWVSVPRRSSWLPAPSGRGCAGGSPGERRREGPRRGTGPLPGCGPCPPGAPGAPLPPASCENPARAVFGEDAPSPGPGSRAGPPGSLSRPSCGVSGSASAEPGARLTLLFSLPAEKRRR